MDISALDFLLARIYCGKIEVEENIDLPPLYNYVRLNFPVGFDYVSDPTRKAGKIVQYWNDSPDTQIQGLLEETKRHCLAAGVGRDLFDQDAAVAFIAREWGERHVQAFRKCSHPAQQSDFFRYCYLAAKGGMWMDADDVLTSSPLPLLVQHHPVFFQVAQKHGLLTNKIIIAPPRERIIEAILGLALSNIEDDSVFDKHMATGDLFSVSGPAVVRSVVAETILDHVRRYGAADPGLRIADLSNIRPYVSNAEKFLGNVPLYKKTQRRWQRWAKAHGYTGGSRTYTLRPRLDE